MCWNIKNILACSVLTCSRESRLLCVTCTLLFPHSINLCPVCLSVYMKNTFHCTQRDVSEERNSLKICTIRVWQPCHCATLCATFQWDGPKEPAGDSQWIFIQRWQPNRLSPLNRGQNWCCHTSIRLIFLAIWKLQNISRLTCDEKHDEMMIRFLINLECLQITRVKNIGFFLRLWCLHFRFGDDTDGEDGEGSPKIWWERGMEKLCFPVRLQIVVKSLSLDSWVDGRFRYPFLVYRDGMVLIVLIVQL